MNTPALIASVDELVAEFSASAARSGPLIPLAALIDRLREPMREPAVWAAVADAMMRNAFAEPAAGVLASALQQYPRHAELHYLRGNALRVARYFDEAETEFRAALALSPAHRQASLSLAYMLRDLGRINAAADVVLAVGRAQASDTSLALTLIEFLRQSGAHAQARELAEAARRHVPANARLAAVGGELELALGDFAAARASLRQAVELAPEQSSAWLRLSYCGHCSDPNDPDLQLLRSAWCDERLSPATRVCAGFGTGKLLDDLDDCAGAAAVLRDANALARSQSSWSADAWQALVDRQIARAPIASLEPRADFVPVFVVGLPRSGTTLVATRLGRHAGVHDRGELNWIGAMYDHLSSQNALGNREALQSVANLIATQMRRDDAPARRYVDKNPLNFRYLNLMLALFPNARIVRCRRGARDTALSLWSQHFAHPDLGFSYDFATIARVQESEARLMAHWRSALPGAAILDVDYEALVADPSAQLARIAEFAGVSGAESDGGGEVITTASVWQARQPVYAQAVGRWRRYAKFVPELTEMFADD
jgi:tetratricopeptide (TPR) repeat protein